MVCKLNTRCTIIAATNPKGGRYDSSVDLNINAGLATPLLTRFDLIMILADKKDATWDEIVAEHILNQNAIVKSQNANMWSFEEMKSYFSLVKSLKPILTNEANDVLCKYYFALRQAAERQMARTTVRMFESLIRYCTFVVRINRLPNRFRFIQIGSGPCTAHVSRKSYLDGCGSSHHNNGELNADWQSS